MRPIGIDLFSGAGGMTLGFEQAGFDVKAAVEIDPIHAAVHKFNFPDCAVLSRSVADVTAADLRSEGGIGNREIACVFGGPPCQGFSMIGHRALSDPRNSLVSDFVRLVSELDAQTFVFENVKGLTIGKHRTVLDEIVQAFDNVGYNVLLPWKVLNAASFGVPQNRERLILLGAKHGFKLPQYPNPITRIPGSRISSDLPEGPTCKDALEDLPDAEAFSELIDGDSVAYNFDRLPSRYAAKLRCLTNDSWDRGYIRNWNPGQLTCSWRTEHSEISRRRFAATLSGQTEQISRFYRLESDGLANTLRAGTDGARGAFTSPRPIHYKYPRCITVREMARLHGFPDWFRTHSTKWHGAREIGNAVPPPLAQAIAKQVVSALGILPHIPQGAVELGDNDLLYLSMTEAAQIFGIDPPRNKRDKKSGARKRSQIETEIALMSVQGHQIG